jgi:hypothetical protein
VDSGYLQPPPDRQIGKWAPFFDPGARTEVNAIGGI